MGAAVPARRLGELAPVIRSKNAKPYRLTLDVIFDRRDIFEYVKRSGVLTVAAVADAYRIAVTDVTSSFIFEPGMAFKFTLKRPVVQGAIGDSDIYGAQQHAPLLDLLVPWDQTAPSLDRPWSR